GRLKQKQMRIYGETRKPAPQQRVTQDERRTISPPGRNSAGSQCACERREKLDGGEKAGLSLDDGQAGLFSTIQFLAALAGTLASSAIASWWGYRPALVLGYALLGGGLAGLTVDPHLLLLQAA